MLTRVLFDTVYACVNPHLNDKTPSCEVWGSPEPLPPTTPTFCLEKNFLQPHMSTGRSPMASGPCLSWGVPFPNLTKAPAWGHATGSALPLGQEGSAGMMYGTARHSTAASKSRARHRQLIPWKPKHPHAPAHRITGVGETAPSFLRNALSSCSLLKIFPY